LLVLAAGILVAIPLYLWRIELFTLMGAGPKVLPHVLEYMSQWLPAIPLIMLNLASNNTLRAAGSPAKSALVLTVVAAVNGLLDPLLIFGLGPIPGMGMAGAALAAVTAWIVSCAVSDHLLSVHEHLILRGRPQWRSLLVNWQQLLPIGVPAIFANLLTPIATAVLTAMVANFGATAVAGFGVCTRIDALSMIVVFALSATLPLFIGQNIGAGKIERARHALFTALKFSLLFQITVYLPLAILAPRIGALFSDNPQVIDTIAIYLRVVPLSYGAHAIVILVMVSLNALKRPRTALLTTVLRLLAINLPLAWLGGRLWGAAGLFTGFAGGNLIAGVLAYRIIQRVWREEFPPAAAA
ncbi:MAG: MATE family efflux transporter, partial [Porticoccaceae bacterium]